MILIMMIPEEAISEHHLNPYLFLFHLKYSYSFEDSSLVRAFLVPELKP